MLTKIFQMADPDDPEIQKIFDKHKERSKQKKDNINEEKQPQPLTDEEQFRLHIYYIYVMVLGFCMLLGIVHIALIPGFKCVNFKACKYFYFIYICYTKKIIFYISVRYSRDDNLLHYIFVVIYSLLSYFLFLGLDGYLVLVLLTIVILPFNAMCLPVILGRQKLGIEKVM